MSSQTEIAETIRRDFIQYATAVHRLPDGSPPFPAPHHQVWASILADPSYGDTLLVAPPAHAKTFWAGVYFLAWYVGNHPEKHIVYIGNTYDQAVKQSIAVRDTIKYNPRFKALFPNVRLDPGKGAGQDKWYVTRSSMDDKDPTFLALGVNGPLLGSRADLMILDDVNDAENTNTPENIAKVRDWVSETAYSRLTPGGRMVIIMTRWHQADLAAWAMEFGFFTCHIPALSSDEQVYATLTRAGEPAKRVLIHSNGPALWPELWSTEFLRRRELVMGPAKFARTYQGNPIPDEGGVFKRAWWKFYQPEDLPPMVMSWQTWDTAFEAKTSADYSVGMTWQLGVNGRLYLVDMMRERLDTPDLRRAMRQFWEKWRVSEIWVEDRGNGKVIIQELRDNAERSEEYALPVIPWKDQNRDKVKRAHAVTGYFHAGLVYLPLSINEPWVNDLIVEAEFFPNGSHDDMVDAMVMGVSRYAQTARPAISDEDDDAVSETFIGNWEKLSF